MSDSGNIGGFPTAKPYCLACKKPLEVKNAWMTDGCPCNSKLGCNDINQTRWRLLMELQHSVAGTLAARESELAEAQRRVENLMAERDRWSGLYSRLQDERAADFAKWFKIIDFGGLTEYQAECPQVIDLALRELTSWRWLAEMYCTAQAMASTITNHPYWVVFDVDGEALGEGETPIAAIEDARKNFLPLDRITHIPGKESDDGEMH